MNTERLRRADFKTGIILVAACLWLMGVTFAFMPFRETYGGVENAWYVSPWIFPAVVLTLLLVVSLVLTVNAALRGGHLDVVRFPDARWRSFRLTGTGRVMAAALAVASGAGLVYLVVNIEEKIRVTREEAKWLADPSTAEVFDWSSPTALVPLAIITIVFLFAAGILAVSLLRPVIRTAAPADAADDARRETKLRFGVIALLFVLLVYVFVPYVDFFVAVLLFLYVFTTLFHVDHGAMQRAALVTFIAAGVFTALVRVLGLHVYIDAYWTYFSDAVVFAATVGVMAWNHRLGASIRSTRASHRTVLAVSWITPLVLVPVFRFGLLVPLPYEGGAVELLHQLRYLLR